jgi:NAD(P)-dependent dehydrogenase (short-subunit alcohol dehydrogenase family)
LKSKTIWITGASSGIGRELALQLAAAGHTVIASARTLATLESLAGEAQGTVLPLALDVTDEAQMDGLDARLRALTDRLDVCVVNAGACEYLDVNDLDIGQFQQVFDVNTTGAARTVKAALPLMRGGDRAQLVAVSSMSTLIPFGRAQAYGASKAALEYFFRCCEIDLANSNIDVTIVRPGFVDTPLTRRNTFKMPFLIEPPEAARRMIAGIESGHRLIAFPRRLNAVLMVLRYVPFLWSHWLGPKMAGSSR